jgi:hypothetical protein
LSSSGAKCRKIETCSLGNSKCKSGGISSFVVVEDSDASDADTASKADKVQYPLNEALRGRSMIEGFAGSARYAAAVKLTGVRAMAVDWKRNKDKPSPSVRCVWIDLATVHGLSEMKALVAKENAGYVSLAPPCGTSSLAREIRRKGQGDGGPPPLRSKEFPDGLLSLVGINKDKVESANALYRNTISLVIWLSSQGIAWSIENPQHSLMWLTSPFMELEKCLHEKTVVYADVNFQHCMHGGERDKRTKIRYSGLDFACLEAQCDGKHTHKPWGLVRGTNDFATAEERRYPLLLCRRMARVVAGALKSEPTTRPKGSVPEERTFNSGQSRKGAANLVPEYSKLVQFKGCNDSNVDLLTEILKKDPLDYRKVYLPVGSKVLSRSQVVGVKTKSTGIPQEDIEVGVAWEPHRFVEEAKLLKHPLDEIIKVPPAVACALLAQASLGPLNLVHERDQTIRWMQCRRQELAEEELKLKSKLHPEVRSVVEQKQILLFKELLIGMGYDDIGVADLLITGVKLVGTVDRVGIWVPDESRIAKSTVESLWASARQAQDSVIKANTGNFSDRDREVWESAEEEVSAGFLKGRFTAQELEKIVGPRWIAARRFGIVQGEKFRPIDDFSEHGINGAYGMKEKAHMKGLDQIVAWARAWVDSRSADGRVVFTDTASKTSSTTLHNEWGEDGWTSVLGRVADLKKAYKQLPSSPAHSCFGIISAKNPSGQPRFFRALSLMFGTTAAVFAFLRFSRAISALATYYLKLVVVEFFDDFTQLEPSLTAESGQWALEELLSVLGWDLAMGDKRLPFDASFVSLGVLVDLTKINARMVTLRNKAGRIEAIMAEVRLIMKSGVLDFKGALSLKGKLYFSESQTYGRALAPVSRVLSCWASKGGCWKIDDVLMLSLQTILEHFAVVSPRVICPRRIESPALVFTDGACEEDYTSIGGVIWCEGLIYYFGSVIPPEVVASWASKHDQKQVIGQAELFPVLVAKLTWRSLLAGRRAIYFLDNDSARLALVKAYSPVLPSIRIVMSCLDWDFRSNSDSWYARVPTAANISDGPSRMDPSALLARFPARVMPPVFPEGIPRGKVLS